MGKAFLNATAEFSVHRRPTASVDADFAYLSRAHTLVLTGSGYQALAAHTDAALRPAAYSKKSQILVSDSYCSVMPRLWQHDAWTLPKDGFRVVSVTGRYDEKCKKK